MKYSTGDIHNDNIELEIVDADGRPIVRHPIDISKLHAQQGRTIDLGNGVHVQMDGYEGNSSEVESDDDSEEYEEEDGMDSVSSNSDNDEHVPAGYHKLSDWYDALHAARQRHQQQGTPSIPVGAGESRDHKLSRGEVWASFSPPLDKTRNYQRLQCVSLMPSAMSRRFWLPPLMYHAAATYHSSTDPGQRVLVYGGTTNLGRTVESELYEFTLLTGSWRRLEGRQFVPPGCYGHAMVVVPSQQRLVVIGGIGPGGRPLPREVLADEFCRRRFRFLFPRRESAMAVLAAAAQQPEEGVVEGSERMTLLPLLLQSEKPKTIGFVPVLFDMATKTQRWRAVQTAHEVPVVLHTAVTIGGAIFVFGGVTNRLLVSTQLIRIDVESYGISLVHPPGPSPKARFLHSAVVYGNWMIIYGGFDVHNEPLNDAWAFDVANERWELLDAVGAPQRGGHAACTVGSRMVIVGGFESAFGDHQPPTSSVFELQLVPNNIGKHVWRGIPVRPSIPPIAFATASPCGDDASFLLYGGSTLAPVKQKPIHPTTVRSRSYSHHHRDKHRDGTNKGVVPSKLRSGGDLHHTETEDDSNKHDADIWSHLVTYGDGHIFTFPTKTLPSHRTDGDGASHADARSVETNADEIPATFMAFVRRQQDFLLKKSAAVSLTMRKTCLEEMENMEPQLYLTPEEIELLVTSSEELCECFVEYPMGSMPLNIPDRDARVHIHEECVSLGRQVRDVLRSMKGSDPGITAVKSKMHRKRTGEKFEDHSAKKPFRRVVVVSLLRDIHRQLHKVHLLNKALRTIQWEEKGVYVAAIHKMRDKSKEFGMSIKRVLEKYIEQRINSLIEGVAKRKEKMRLLAAAIEKNRHDTIFHRDGRDLPRERVRHSQVKNEKGNVSDQQQEQQPLQKHDHKSRPRHRSKSTGAGYYKDESQVAIPLLPKQRDQFVRLADAVQRAAEAFGTYCRTNPPLSSTPMSPGTAVISRPLSLDGESLSPPQQQQQQPPPVPPPQAIMSDSLVVPLAYACVPPPVSVPPSALVIRNSDALRQSASELADVVKGRTSDFVRAMNESSTAVPPGEPVLRLSMLRPLLECKERATAFTARVCGIRSNAIAIATAGPSEAPSEAPSDVEAERRCRRLAKSLTALTQCVTMSFLTRAGARPRRAVPLPQSKPQPQPPLVRERRASSRMRGAVVEGKGTITVTELSDGLSSPKVEERGTIAYQEQQQHQQQQQHPPVAFTKLSVSPPFDDVPMVKPSGEATFPSAISITSDAAMALVPTLSYTLQAEGGDAIVPSVKDIKTVPNTLPAASGGAGVWVDGIPPMHAPSGSILLATGPSVTADEKNAYFALHSGLITSSPRQMSETSIFTNPQRQMISFSPGFFRLGDGPLQDHDASAFAVCSPHNVDVEDDYFFFGRRCDSAADAVPAIVPTQPIPAEPVFVPSVREVKTSPPIGTATPALGPSTSFSRHQVTHSSIQRLHTSVASPAVGTTAVRRMNGDSSSDMFRGKLTPGEALILRGRDRLRAMPSRQ